MIVFYNDALTPSFAEKHPGALGCAGREVWADAWPFVGAKLEDVLERGVSQYVKDVVIPFARGSVIAASRKPTSPRHQSRIRS